MKPVIGFLCALLTSLSASANWELDMQQSRVHFISSKKVHINEVHHFKTFAGSISDQGQIKVAIELASVETLIPIRNTRMQEKLFEIAKFPQAVLTAQLPKGVLDSAVGSTQIVELKGKLDLHGVSKKVPLVVHVTRSDKNTFIANTVQPVLIDARQFNLSAGVDVLKKLAGLDAISYVVPVSFTAVFKQ